MREEEKERERGYPARLKEENFFGERCLHNVPEKYWTKYCFATVFKF